MIDKANDIITILGANGFVGSNIAKRLKSAGYKIRGVIRKKRELAYEIHEIKKIDYQDSDQLEKALQNSAVVINTIGIIREKSGNYFYDTHVNIVRKVVQICEKYKIKLIHISALGTTEKAITEYYRTKFEAEKIIRSSICDFIILRPGIIWAENSDFVKILKSLQILKIRSVPQTNSTFNIIEIDKLTEIIQTIIEKDIFNNETYEVAEEQDYTLDALIDKAGIEKPIFKVHIPIVLIEIISKLHFSFLPSDGEIKMLKNGVKATDFRIFEILNRLEEDQ